MKAHRATWQPTAKNAVTNCITATATSKEILWTYPLSLAIPQSDWLCFKRIPWRTGGGKSVLVKLDESNRSLRFNSISLHYFVSLVSRQQLVLFRSFYLLWTANLSSFCSNVLILYNLIKNALRLFVAGHFHSKIQLYVECCFAIIKQRNVAQEK